MAVKFTNNAVTTLTAGISAGATQFVVASNSGFPTVAGSDYTYLTVGEEVVKVTGISGTTFTCDATSSSHTNGSNVELRMTAELLTDFATDLEAMPKTGGTFTGDINFGDSVKANFGSGNDLQIYHVANAHSYIKDLGTGNFYLETDGDKIVLRTTDATKTFAKFTQDSSVQLYYANAEKIATTSTGIDVTGNIDLADNGKLLLGNADDLQIYHDGINSYISDGGTGSLKIKATDLYLQDSGGSNFIVCTDTGTGGSVTIKHENATKLATTSTGIDVTGTVTADGIETLATSGDVGYRLGYNAGSSAYIHRDSTTGHYLLESDETGSSWLVRTDDGAGSLTRLSVERDGDISFYEDTGTTPKFFWDASAESLGIGTSSPTLTIDVRGEAVVGSGTDGVKLTYSAGSSTGIVDTGFTSTGIEIRTGNVQRMLVNSTGIDVTGTTQTDTVEIGNGSAGGTSEILFSDNVSARGKIVYDHSASPETLILSTTGTNAIVIDNSQNVSMPNGDLDVTGSGTFNTTGDSNSSKGLVINTSGTNFESDDGIIQVTHAGGGSTTGGYFMKLKTGGADKFTIKGNGDVVTGGVTATSSAGDTQYPLTAYHPTSTSTRTIARFQSNVGGTAEDKVVIKADGSIDVTGTVTAGDGHTFGSDASDNLLITSSAGENLILDSGDDVFLKAGSANRLKVDNSGDISFYEDTGTTPKFFWDASAESLGIGTSSPAQALDVVGAIKVSDGILNAGAGGSASVFNEDGTTADFRVESTSNTHMLFVDGGQNRVGIGATPVAGDFEVHCASGGELRVDNYGSSGVLIKQLNGGSGTSGSMLMQAGSNIILATNDTNEAMRIDSSGNVGIGTSSPESNLHIEGDGVSALRFGNIGVSSNSALRISRNDTTISGTNALGYLEFGGNDTTNNVDTAHAYVGGIVEGTHSGGNNPTALIFGTTPSSSGTPTERLRIDSSGNVGIGVTSPSAKLEVGSTFGAQISGNGAGVGVFGSNAHTTNGSITVVTSHGSYGGSAVTSAWGSVRFHTLGGSVTAGASIAERMRIDSSGKVGIGVSSPIELLHLKSASGDTRLMLDAVSGSDTEIKFYNAGVSQYTIGHDDNTDNFVIGTANVDTPLVSVDKSGNVSIGSYNANANADNLVIYETGDNSGITLAAENNQGSNIYFADPQDDNVGGISYNHASNYMNFRTNGAERMRIDSGGVLLLGQTTGVAIGGGAVDLNATEFGRGYININRDDTGHNRLLQFGGNGVTIGSISGVSTGNGSIVVGNDSSGIMFRGDLATSAFIPASPASGAQVDNTLDVGHSAIRFDDIYATNGTIQTSDRNEKQDIEELSVAETAVATACKGLMRKFRWKSAVAEKGDDARIHFGIIAQDLQDAFTAEGLDAGDYAMFISTTWWETQTEVPAVEAAAEVTDEDGNVTTEAVEAKDAYTRTDTFHTLEEAPEGATERTRLGVRYPELLAFIISAI